MLLSEDFMPLSRVAVAIEPGARCCAMRSPRIQRVASLVVWLVAMAGCGPTNGSKGTTSADDAKDAASTDVQGDSAAADTVGADTASADTSRTPQPGSIGAPCSSPNDCDSTLCLETPQGQRCSKFCGDGVCPSGWACEGKKGGADATFFCIPVGGLTCRPCTADAQCEGSGHAGARCVDYGDVGGFCGVACQDDGGCGSGQACREVASVQGGAKSKQCVQAGTTADTLGLCTCSADASDKGLQTTCYVTTGDAMALKRCKGSRACGANGLGACQPLQGESAVCQEAQCLDLKTATPLADGTACDDGRACTEGDACKQGVCQAGKQTCACEPGILDCPAASGDEASNKCLGAPYCKAQPAGAAKPWACVPNPAGTKVCDASLDDACNTNACAPLSGSCTVTAIERTEEICDLPPAKDGAPNGCRRQVLPSAAPPKPAAACDDGLPCSPGDACSDGACKPTSLAACGCVNDVDCKDDGDLCNGTPYCDKTGSDGGGNPVWQCKTNPATIITCDQSKDSGCQQTSCEPKSGVCAKVVKPEFAPCDDGVACTKGDVCSKDGACQPGTWTCCKADADCAGEEDGNLCNGTLFCNLASGNCEANPATKISCPSVDDTECLQAQCAPKTGKCGLVPVNVGGKCSDGNACSDLDTCDAKGSCTPGKDTCPCKVDADCVQFDDGDLCNGTLYCNPIAGPDGTGVCRPNPKTVVVCPTVDDTACSRNRCNSKTGTCGVVQLPANVTCDADGTACTANDACDGKGSCVPGTIVCACQTDADCANKEDGDLCNGTLFCDKSGPAPVCKLNPATVKTCPSVNDTACKKNVCQPLTGTCVVAALPASAPCSDGEACTGGDHCDGGGSCVAGPIEACGCKNDADCKGFDDGDVCNGAYVCTNKACVFNGKALNCNDDNVCTKDSCDAAKGCQHVGLTGCVTCTKADDCNDANTCTFDLCSLGQCDWQAAPLACEDGDACTLNDSCADKVCKAGSAKTCNDGNPCTVDSCSPAKGCVYDGSSLEGKACDVGGSGVCTKSICKLTCGPGYDEVQLDVNGTSEVRCAANSPVWGFRPNKPVGVYSVDKIGNDEVVNDSQTKLMWQRATSTSTKQWAAAKAHCNGLVFAGHADWRLPTVVELASLIDHTAAKSAPHLDVSAFPTVAAAFHWAATPRADLTSEGWVVNFSNGAANPLTPEQLLGALCVRTSGLVARTTPRFLLASNDTIVQDTWTKLEWQRGKSPEDKVHSAAIDYCTTLALNGSGWRLPTPRELHSLIDFQKFSPPIDITLFPSTPVAGFWTATNYPPGDDANAMGVEFWIGNIQIGGTQFGHPVRCVRGDGT